MVPEDAVEISDELYHELLRGQSSGKQITAGPNGIPALSDPVITGVDIALGKILTIEASITPRRLREAVLGMDGGWLAEQNAKIQELRNNIKS